MPLLKNDDEGWIWCDGCSIWYHQECIRETCEKFGFPWAPAHEDEPFFCQKCKKLQNLFLEKDELIMSKFELTNERFFPKDYLILLAYFDSK